MTFVVLITDITNRINTLNKILILCLPNGIKIVVLCIAHRKMILDNFLGGLLARLPKQYTQWGITVVILLAGVSAVWLALKAAHARELDSKDHQIAVLTTSLSKERARGDSLTGVIINDKVVKINEQAEENRRLSEKLEEVNDYVYENQIRDDINKRKAKSSNQELKRILKKKDQ